jgi:hypothetical protein
MHRNLSVSQLANTNEIIWAFTERKGTIQTQCRECVVSQPPLVSTGKQMSLLCSGVTSPSNTVHLTLRPLLAVNAHYEEWEQCYYVYHSFRYPLVSLKRASLGRWQMVLYTISYSINLFLLIPWLDQYWIERYRGQRHYCLLNQTVLFYVGGILWIGTIYKLCCKVPCIALTHQPQT